MLEAFLILFILLSGFLTAVLYRVFADRADIESDLLQSEADKQLLERKIETLSATNQSLREDLRTYRYDPATGVTTSEPTFRPLSDFVGDIEVEGQVIDEVVTPVANEQHFRPMYDSQGALFNEPSPAPTNDYINYPETYQEVPANPYTEEPQAVAVVPEIEEEDTSGDTEGTSEGQSSEPVGEDSGPESVQDGQEATNGVLRSGSVPNL